MQKPACENGARRQFLFSTRPTRGRVLETQPEHFMNPRLPPTRRALSRYSVNRPGWEVIKQSLYDSAAYPAAGATQLTFFSVPVGQSSKSLSDTNMSLAGQLPKNQEFLVQSVEILFHPSTPTVAAQMPAVYGAGVVAALVNDAYIFGRSGNLTLTIGSKPYLQEAPLGRLPGKVGFDIDASASDASTAAASQQSRVAFGKWVGRPMLLDPAPLLLPENQNFTVSLTWPEGLQAITNPARVVVILDGLLYRRSQ